MYFLSPDLLSSISTSSPGPSISSQLVSNEWQPPMATLQHGNFTTWLPIPNSSEKSAPQKRHAPELLQRRRRNIRLLITRNKFRGEPTKKLPLRSFAIKRHLSCSTFWSTASLSRSLYRYRSDFMTYASLSHTILLKKKIA